MMSKTGAYGRWAEEGWGKQNLGTERVWAFLSEEQRKEAGARRDYAI